MNTLRLSIPLALGSLFMVPQLSRAAEPNTPPAEKPASGTTDLENHIKALEARIHDLEAQLDDRATLNNNHSMRQFRDRMKRDLGNNFAYGTCAAVWGRKLSSLGGSVQIPMESYFNNQYIL